MLGCALATFFLLYPCGSVTEALNTGLRLPLWLMAVHSACMSMSRCVVLFVLISKCMMMSSFPEGTFSSWVSPFAYVALAVVTCMRILV